MGRPLNKKYMGSPALPGKHVVMTSAWIAGEVGPAEGFYVVRQVGTGRYQVTNGAVTGVVRLADAGPLEQGEAHLVVNPFGDDNDDEYVRIIHNRSVKTWEGHSYKWSLEAAAAEGECDMPLKPSDVTPVMTMSSVVAEPVEAPVEAPVATTTRSRKASTSTTSSDISGDAPAAGAE